MIKLIAWREDGWMPPNTDRRQWEAVARAYGADLQMIGDWVEAEVPAGYSVILVDEAGSDELGDFAPPAGDVVYVFGRSQSHLESLAGGAKDGAVRIGVVNPRHSLFGCCAAAVVLDYLARR